MNVHAPLRRPLSPVRARLVMAIASAAFALAVAPPAGTPSRAWAALPARSSLEALRASTQALASRTAVLEGTRERLEAALAEKADLDRRASLAAEKARRAVTARERAAREVERKRLDAERDASIATLAGLERDALRDVSTSKDLVRETQKIALASREEETRERDKPRRAALHEAIEKASLALRRAEEVLASKTLTQLAAPRPDAPPAPTAPEAPAAPPTSPDAPLPAPSELTPTP